MSSLPLLRLPLAPALPVPPVAQAVAAPRLLAGLALSGNRRRQWSLRTLPSGARQKAFQEGLRCERVEEALAEALQSRDLPKVVNAAEVYDNMRKCFFKEYFDRKKALSTSGDPETVRELRNKARLRFAALGLQERITLAQKAAASTQCDFTAAQRTDLENKAVLLGALAEARASDLDTKFLRGKGAVLTYVSRRKMQFTAPEGVRSVEETVNWLRQRPPMVALWARFRTFAAKVSEEKLLVSQWSIAAELCTVTLAEEGKVQVHLHLGVTKGGGELYYKTAEAAGVIFEGLVPHSNSRSIPGVSLQGGNRGSQNRLGAKKLALQVTALNAVHYYLQCEEKLGSICRDGSKEPFKQYPVKASWISAWVQAWALRTKSCYASGKSQIQTSRKQCVTVCERV